MDELVLGLAVIGLVMDLGSVTTAPANVVAALTKGLFKCIPAPVRRGLIWASGGGRLGFVRISKYVSKFVSGQFEGVSDYVKLRNYYRCLEKLTQQLYRMLDSKILRQGDLPQDQAAYYVGNAIDLLADRGQSLSDTAAEGIACYCRHGDEGVDALDDVIVKMTDGLDKLNADVSVEGLGEAITKTYRDKFPDGGPVKDARGVERVNNAVAAGRRSLDPHLRNLVSPHIGPDKVIKSMREFETLRHMQANNLTPEQVQGINAIRQAIGLPGVGDDLVKVLDLDSAVGKLGVGDPNLTGFFGKKADLGEVTTTEQLIGAQRLDYDGSPFNAGSPHVILETQMTQNLRDSAKIPRHGGYLDGSGNEFQIPQGSRKYPNTGNGLISSTDGRLRPESYMSTATAMPEQATFMRIRNPDGSPKVISVNGHSASEWKLIIDPDDPEKLKWVPVP
ncbi:MAG: hypothetical protein FLDDKLPJ_00380 [Phycisphaerae bacterium]|nr:hypothetical protein [Phycisphaerae bacterium]